MDVGEEGDDDDEGDEVEVAAVVCLGSKIPPISTTKSAKSSAETTEPGLAPAMLVMVVVAGKETAAGVG